MEKLLLIEDDAAINSSLKKILDKEGFKTITAADGKEGMDKFHSEHPEIVITDLKLPHMDGLQVMEQIKKENPDVEIILITGKGDYEVAIAALQKGATDYLKKPIELEDLLLALGRCQENLNKKHSLITKPIVLVMEDDASARKFLIQAMEKEGWAVLGAEDGAAGMATFQKESIDIVITDISMPNKTGLQVLSEIKSTPNNDCEVILMTGYGDESTAIEAMRKGAISYVKKPIDLDYMLITVEKAFEKLRLDRSNRYKAREIEQKKQIIAKLTDKGLSLSMGGAVPQSSIEYLRKLFDLIPAGVLVVDKNANVIYSNQQIDQALGYTPKVFDQKVIQRFSDSQVESNDAKKIIEEVTDIAAHVGQVKKVQTGSHAYLVATATQWSIESKDPQVVSLLFRGPRAK